MKLSAVIKIGLALIISIFVCQKVELQVRWRRERENVYAKGPGKYCFIFVYYMKEKIVAFSRSLSTAVCSADPRLSYAKPLSSYQAKCHATPGTAQHSTTQQKHLIVSFHDAWRVRISITTQYNSINMRFQQLVNFADPGLEPPSWAATEATVALALALARQ